MDERDSSRAIPIQVITTAADVLNGNSVSIPQRTGRTRLIISVTIAASFVVKTTEGGSSQTVAFATGATSRLEMSIDKWGPMVENSFTFINVTGSTQSIAIAEIIEGY